LGDMKLGVTTPLKAVNGPKSLLLKLLQKSLICKHGTVI
jgi:hypothetical protein